jgi:tetratricopeptide (TPR) repeat protein
MSWFTQRFEREEKPLAATIPARRRRMLLWSMILVIPLGLFSVGTGINVVIAAGVQQTFASGDYQAAAAWARAGVSLNPFDRYLPNYNLGTAYAAGDLLPEAVPELQTALDNAPSPEAACYPRANLALTYVRLGNRYFDDRRWLDAIAAYRAAKALWAEQPGDVCRQDPSFDETAEESSEEAEQNEQQAQENQQQDPQDPNPSQTPDPNSTPTPDPSASPTPDPSASPTPDPSAPPTPSPTPGQTGEPQPSPTPGQTGDPQPQPTPGQTGEPQPGDPQPGDPGGEQTSESLGDGLDQLIEQGEAADRERENGGRKHGLADKPW